MNKRLLFLNLLLSISMMACAPIPLKTYEPVLFNESEYAEIELTGTGVLVGQIFAKTMGGDVKKGAGNTVVLLPVTSYSEQRIREQVILGKYTSKAEDPRHLEYGTATTADAEGNFKFVTVPPGDYYVFSNISWVVPTANGLKTTGGNVYRKVTIENDKETLVYLTL